MTRHETDPNSRRIFAKACFASVCLVLLVGVSLIRTPNFTTEIAQSVPKPDVQRTDKVLRPQNLEIFAGELKKFISEATDRQRLHSDTGIGAIDLSKILYGRRLAWLVNESKPLSKTETFDVEGADNVEVGAICLHILC